AAGASPAPPGRAPWADGNSAAATASARSAPAVGARPGPPGGCPAQQPRRAGTAGRLSGLGRSAAPDGPGADARDLRLRHRLLVLLALTFGLQLWGRAATPDMLFSALAMLAFLQAMALILNLLPFPGLDGFNVLRPFLPRSWTRGLQKFEGLSMLALLGLLFF